MCLHKFNMFNMSETNKASRRLAVVHNSWYLLHVAVRARVLAVKYEVVTLVSHVRHLRRVINFR